MSSQKYKRETFKYTCPSHKSFVEYITLSDFILTKCFIEKFDKIETNMIILNNKFIIGLII